MILDTVNKKIQVVLGEAMTTTECDIVVSYVDITTATFLAAGGDRTTSGTTAVDAIAAPVAGVQRQVKEITVYNRDTVPHDITVQLKNGSSTRKILTETVPVNESLVYRPDALRGPQGDVGATGATGADATDSGQHFGIDFYFDGMPPDGGEVFRYRAWKAFTLAVGLSQSQFSFENPPADADAVFTININGASAGIVTFAMTTGAPTVTFTSLTAYDVGDILTIYGPSPQDSAMSGVAWNLVAIYA